MQSVPENVYVVQENSVNYDARLYITEICRNRILASLASPDLWEICLPRLVERLLLAQLANALVTCEIKLF